MRDEDVGLKGWGLKVWGCGFRGWWLGLGDSELYFWIYGKIIEQTVQASCLGAGCGILDEGCWVQGAGRRVQDVGCGVEG